MTKITQTQINTLRTHPHRTKLWLSIYQPTTILAARVDDATIDKGARVITYDSVTSGSYLSIQSGMTMYIGTEAGYSDKGTVRVRSATSTTITVAENSHIVWADNLYLTVVDFYEIAAIFPRIIQNPADETKTIWYKDYDIEYTNQNSLNGAFTCMGTHFAGFLEDGSCNVFYSASGTSHVNGETMTYNWWFGGATTTGSADHTPGYITYDTPGHYTTRLEVTGASGSVDYSYRHISIYDRPDAGNNPPILKWQLDKLSGNIDSGEYGAEITIFEGISEALVRDGSLIVIFSEDWYDGVKTSIGGNQENRSSIVFNGYVESGSLRYNWRDKSVSFSVRSPTGIMKLAEGFSVSLEDIDDPVSRSANDPGTYPSPWVLIPSMGVKKAVWHYLKWHSTVLMCTDFQFSATDQLIQYFDADRQSLFNAVDTGMKSILVGSISSDMQGKLWAEVDTYLREPSYRSTISISSQDWIGDVSFEIAMSDPVSFIEMGGIAYTGFGGTSTPLLSAAPGVAPGYRGSVERIQGLALTGQTQLNQINGRLYAYLNREYTLFTMQMAGNYRIFDIAPQDRYTVSVASTQNPRGRSLSLDSFVQNIEWVYNPEKETFVPTIGFTHLGTWIDAETMSIPPIPPTEGEDGGTYRIPPIVIPPITIPGISISMEGGVGSFVPCISGYNSTDGNACVQSIDGVIIPSSKAYAFYGTVYLPEAGTYTFTPYLAGNDGDGTSQAQTSAFIKVVVSADESTDDYDMWLNYTSNINSEYASFPVTDSDYYMLKLHAVGITVASRAMVDLNFRSVDTDGVGFAFKGWAINYV